MKDYNEILENVWAKLTKEEIENLDKAYKKTLLMFERSGDEIKWR